MKGIIFVEFLEMVENKFSADLVDEIIEASDLASDGIYTTVGIYDHQEIFQLLSHLSAHTEQPAGELVYAFGEYLFDVFVKSYSQFFTNVTGTLEFLHGVESYIHVEVKKLYPHAELPSFSYQQPDEHTLIMDYSSTRPFSMLAKGLISGCIKHFDDNTSMESADTSAGSGTSARFTLTRKS